jgi:hypothetical protein
MQPLYDLRSLGIVPFGGADEKVEACCVISLSFRLCADGLGDAVFSVRTKNFRYRRDLGFPRGLLLGTRKFRGLEALGLQS